MESILGAFNPNTKTTIQFRLLNVKNIEPGILGLGRTDPFVKLQKRNWDPEKGVVQWITVHRTEYMLNNLNPVFQAFSLSLETLCYADPQWPLRLIVFDWERSGKHRTLGCYYTNWDEIKQLVATNGNADRSKALTISMEERATAMALLIILQADESDT
jgi:C2 domain